MRTATLLLALCASAFAVDPEKRKIPKFGDPWESKVTGSVQYESATGLDGVALEVDRFLARVRAEASGPLTTGSNVTVSLGYEERIYSWDGAGTILGSSDPWDNIHVLNASVIYLQGISQTWGILGRVGATVAAEEFGDWWDAVSWGAALAVGHEFSKDLRVAVGAGMYDPPGDDPYFIPVIQFQWIVDKSWTIEWIGLGPEAIYKTGTGWEFALGGWFDTTTFRLREDAPANAALVNDHEIYVYVRGTWRPDEVWALTLRLGVIPWQKIEVGDSRGKNETSYDGDDLSWVVSFNVTARW